MVVVSTMWRFSGNCLSISKRQSERVLAKSLSDCMLYQEQYHVLFLVISMLRAHHCEYCITPSPFVEKVNTLAIVYLYAVKPAWLLLLFTLHLSGLISCTCNEGQILAWLGLCQLRVGSPGNDGVNYMTQDMQDPGAQSVLQAAYAIFSLTVCLNIYSRL